MRRTSIVRLTTVTAILVAFTTGAFAGTPAKEEKTIVEKTEESWISGDLGIDIYSQYIFHGIVLENQGAILQPYANIYMKLYEGEGALTSATLNLGIWNSLHSNHTVPSTTRWWYEFDFLAGVSFVLFKNLTFTPTYILYSSPGDYFTSSHNLQLRLAYNDSDLLGGFALNPYALVEFELEGKAGNGADEGIYYEVGVSPGTTLGPVAVAFPIKAGFGSHEYYLADAGFGFVSGGVALAYELPFIPEKLGTWTVSASATYYQFGDCCDDSNSVKNGDDHAYVFGGGLKIAF